MAAEVLWLEETDSTNRWLNEHDSDDDRVVWTDYQTAGRGYGTNTWESERGRNLLFSMLYHPKDLPAARQFRLSMAVSLAMVDVLHEEGLGDLTVKWPNDIYWRDGKLAGILIENRLHGAFIHASIVGIGLNVNQTVFVSDAPNPVSMRQITGREYDREALLRRLIGTMEARMNGDDDLSDEYRQVLYWRTGFHSYRDSNGCFEAELIGVATDGHLILRDSLGHERSYAFKEVQFGSS